MGIDYALILGAGLGTRMGELGKVIPKILWPIYFKPMLELQIRYCEDLGISKIYLNTHFLHDEIISFLKTSKLKDKITILHEEILLDSGGAIHNLASRSEVNYKGNLLLVNGDQFLFFNKKHWDEARLRIGSCRAVLFGIKVKKEATYNETIIHNSKLHEIKKNNDQTSDYITYSGLGILNLNGLKPVSGISKFFETVANYKNERVDFVTPDSFEYWDFGTAAIYAENIFKLKNDSERVGEMGKFLNKHLAFNGDEEKYINLELRALDLEFLGRLNSDSIAAKGLLQKI